MKDSPTDRAPGVTEHEAEAPSNPTGRPPVDRRNPLRPNNRYLDISLVAFFSLTVTTLVTLVWFGMMLFAGLSGYFSVGWLFAGLGLGYAFFYGWRWLLTEEPASGRKYAWLTLGLAFVSIGGGMWILPADGGAPGGGNMMDGIVGLFALGFIAVGGFWGLTSWFLLWRLGWEAPACHEAGRPVAPTAAAPDSTMAPAEPSSAVNQSAPAPSLPPLSPVSGLDLRCACGEILGRASGGNVLRAHVIPDQNWHGVLDDFDRIIQEVAAGRLSLLEGQAAMRQAHAKVARTIQQCPKCGQLLIPDAHQQPNLFTPLAPEDSRQILAGQPSPKSGTP